MKLQIKQIVLFLFVNWGIVSLCSAGPEIDHEKDRAKNEIKDDIGYSTESMTKVWSVPIDNYVTTEAPSPGQGSSAPTVEKSTTPPPIPTKTPPHPKPKKKQKVIDPIDQYLLDGILDIVDEKFETINKRMSTLERGIHSIQYYNVRSFRVINTHLSTVDTMLHSINLQLDHTDQQNKEFNQGLGLVKKEMIDLQSLNSGMFQAIEQNLVYFHKDMQSRFEELKEDMDKANKVMGQVKNDTNELRIDTENVRNLQTDILLNTENSMIMTSDVAKGTLFLLNITEHVQQDVAEHVIPISLRSQRAIQTMHSDISILSTDTQEIRNGISSFLTNVSSAGQFTGRVFTKNDEDGDADDDKRDKDEIYRELKVTDSVAHTTCTKMLKLFEDKLQNLTQVSDQSSRTVTCTPTVIGGSSFRNQSRKLMRALATVNENIYQSVTLYKHTGNLIERVISDAELITSDQVRLRHDIQAYLLNGTEDLFNETLNENVGEFVRFDKPVQEADGNKPECKISREVIHEISKLTHNGTQLLELLTELATASTSGMQTSLNKLESEVVKLKQVQEEPLHKAPVFSKLDNFARDDPRVSDKDWTKDLLNRTDWIYQLTEAIASNTGWIPYLFHNIKFVESQINKTLEVSNQLVSNTEDISKKQKIQASSVLNPQRYLASELIKSQANIIQMISTLTEQVNGKTVEKEKSEKPCEANRKETGDLSALTNQSLVMTDMMEAVHGTSVKLNRLLPALTSLLGEPEPYVTLLNGSSDKEGRVEVYYKGEWGTIPGPITHTEAAYICRKLGFLGGISAGNGSFGPGSGVFWNVNVTCLRTRWCTAVHHVPDSQIFNHDNDVGVICDHMIRLEPNEEDLDLSRHTGKLEVYHENAWRPVCHDGWGRPETEVACKQLGFREGASSAAKDELLLNGQWLTSVTCADTVDRLDLCANEGFVFNGCPSSNYVSLVCS